MELALIALVALAIGAGATAWLGARSRRSTEKDLRHTREELARAEAQRDAAKEQVTQIAQDRDTLKDAFGSIAADQLKSNRDEFLKQASERFEKSELKHVGELEKRHDAIDKRFEVLNTTVRDFEEMHRSLEKQRTADFSAMREQVLSLGQKAEALGATSTVLSTALRGSSQSRGRWGEMALRNIVEAAGMTEHCDFVEQVDDASGTRPDLIVMLPGDGRIPIDAKVPYSDYERMVEATDPEARQVHLKQHGDTVRNTMIELAKRDYPGQVGGEVDFTVMFIPIESVAAAAFEARPDLQQEAIERHILIVTPVTLIALLRTVGLYWKQSKIARDAQEIWEAAKELHQRFRVFQAHLSRVGGGLRSAVDNYNRAVGSLESSVLPQGRRVERLSGIESADALSEPDRIENQVRDFAAPESDH